MLVLILMTTMIVLFPSVYPDDGEKQDHVRMMNTMMQSMMIMMIRDGNNDDE